MNIIISAKAITKQYNVVKKLEGFNNKKKIAARKTVLDGVSFEILGGKIVGILGVEGSGKSVLGAILAGKENPTKGTIMKPSQVALIKEQHSLIESDTGITNIKRMAKEKGLTDREIKMITHAIVDFSGSEEIIHLPVHTYSNKIKLFLEFAITVHCDPEVLILDGSLPKETEKYYSAYLKTFNEWKKQKKSIIIMGNVVEELQQLPDEVMWLHNGRMIQYGPYNTVTASFSDFLEKRNACITKEELDALDAELKAKAIVDDTIVSLEEDELPVEKMPSSFNGKKITGGIVAVALLGVGIFTMTDSKTERAKNDSTPVEVQTEQTTHEEVTKPKEDTTKTETNTNDENMTDDAKVEDEKTYAYVNVSTAIVREKPSKKADPITTIPFGDRAEIINKKADGEDVWYQLKLSDGKKGWMHSSISMAFTDSELKASAIQNDSVKELMNSFGYKIKYENATKFFGETSAIMKKKKKQKVEDKENTDKGTIWYTRSYQFLFSNDKLTEFSYRNPDVTKKELTDALGKPMLYDKESGMYGYISEDYLVRVYFKKSSATELTLSKL